MFSENSIVVITSRERNWWWAMQEIIPAIDSVWAGIGDSKFEDVCILCVPLENETKQRLNECVSKPKRIVMTTVTPETEKVALHLRSQLQLDTPMIVYLSGDATEGLHSFGILANNFTQNDVFVVASEADAAATRCSFPDAQVSVIPFPLVDKFTLNDEVSIKRFAAGRFAYVGRVSEQKNLHTLLFAIWILHNWYDQIPKITLDVYSSEDNLGSPNMGIKFSNYGEYLQCLAELLCIDHIVTWHGFKSRDWLFENVHLEPHILVTPSLHSDENFGASVLASLTNGNTVIATAWGGHPGYQEWFSQQLMLVPVHRSTLGPVVDPVLLANFLLRAASDSDSFATNHAALKAARAEFSKSSVIVRTLKMLRRPHVKGEPLKKSSIQLAIDENREIFGGTRKIFTCYADRIAQVFFEAYGMKEPLPFQEQCSYFLPPWVSHSDGVLRIDDPHRGRQSFNLDASVSELIDVIACPSMNICRLPISLVKQLATQGYAFPLPPAV